MRYEDYPECPMPQCICPASGAYEGFCWFHSYLATPQRKLDILQDSPVRRQTDRETFSKLSHKWDRLRFNLYRRQRKEYLEKWSKSLE